MCKKKWQIKVLSDLLSFGEEMICVSINKQNENIKVIISGDGIQPWIDIKSTVFL